MRNLPLALCAVLAAFAGMASMSGCRGSAKTTVVPGTLFRIDFELPHDRPESEGAAFCAGAQSIVLALDENPNEGWEHVVLLDLAGRLYGCGSAKQPCRPGQVVEHSFSPPRRVLAEWVDVAPEDYADTPSNVICRGMFDEDSNIGDLAIEVGAAGEELFTVVIPLLRVGAMNGYFSRFNGTDQPAGTFLGVAPLVHRDDLALVNGGGTLRTDEGGKILSAGGWRAGAAQSDLFVWEPDDLAFERVTPGLPQALAALTATPFAIDAQNHFVLLAGGAGSNLAANPSSWLFTGADGDGTALPGPSMFTPRAHHLAARVPKITDGASFRSGIVITGGCNLGGNNPVSASEFLSSVPPPPIGGVDGTECGSPANGVVFCRRDATPADVPAACQQSYGSTQRTDAGLDTVLWIGGGGSAGASNVLGSVDLGSDIRSVAARPSNPPFASLRGSAVAEARDPNAFYVVGGDTAGFGNTPLPVNAVYLVNGTNNTPAVAGGLKNLRSFATATRLLDERILVTGGRTPPDQLLSSYEIGLVTSDSTIAFSYEPLIDGVSSCDPSSGEGCSAMSQSRADHSAVMVRGSTTWLNGSVVVVGGSDTAQPEIYVPAYQCDATGTLPLGMHGGEQFVVTEADYCDRNRAPLLPIMDPSTRQ